MNTSTLHARFTTLLMHAMMLAFLVSSLQAGITVKVYPQVQGISAPGGLQFKTEPNLASRTTQTINEATVFRAKAFVDTSEGRFYLSEKSYKSLRGGKVGYWAFIPSVAPVVPVSSSPGVTAFPQVQEVIAPGGLQFKTEPNLASRTTQAIAEASVFRAKAFVDTPEGRFFISEKSYVQLTQGKAAYWAYIAGVSNANTQSLMPTPKAEEPFTPEPEETQQGWQMYEQARFGEAEAVFRKVFGQQKAKYGTDSRSIHDSLRGLTDTLIAQGKLSELEPLLLLRHHVIELTGSQTAGHSVAGQTLIQFYEMIGDDEKAVQWMEKYAKDFLDDGYGDNAEAFYKPAIRSHYARILTGESYMRVGRFQEAEKVLSFALEGINRVVKGGGNYLEIAENGQAGAQVAMADLHLILGKNREALALFEKAAATVRAYSKKHPDQNDAGLAAILVKIGKLRLAQGEIEIAEQILQEASSIMVHDKTAAAAYDKSLLDCASALGASHLIRGNRAGALEQAQRVAQLQKQSLSEILSFGSERQRLVFRETQRPYDLFAALQDGHALAETALQTKGVVLDSICEDQMIAREAGNNRLLTDLKTSRSELQFLRLKAESDDFKVTPAMLDGVRSRVETLEGELAKQGQLVSGSRRALKIVVDDVQHSLTKNSVLVEYIRYGQIMSSGKLQPAYGAVIIASSGVPSFQHCGSSAEVDAKIASHRELAGQSLKQGETLGDRDAALEKICRELHAMLAAPVEKALPPDTKEVILCPDGQLHFLAFASLLNENGQFWGEKFTLRNVSTGRDLIKQPKKHEAGTNQDIVLLGNPDYVDTTPQRLATQAAAETNAASAQNLVAMNLRGGLSNNVRGMDFNPLPGTAEEVAGLKTRFDAQGWKARVLVGLTATESALQSIQAPAILHLATHGFFLDELQVGKKSGSRVGTQEESFVLKPTGSLRDPMLCSGLALSGSQSTMNLWSDGKVPPLDQDGILTASEAASLNLNGTFLVTLSACETGLGEAKSGEGVLGLKRGFAVAGAENLLMTLWQISDDETVALMGAFYDHVLNGQHPALALPAVQKEALVRLRKEQGLFHAIRVAAPFVLVGGTALP